MDPYNKYIATIIVVIISIIIVIFFGYKARKKHKRKVIIAVALLFLSMITNRSFYWVLYWDGPFYGRVVDAETGVPVAGANVAVTWQFEHNILFGTGKSFANAKETVADSDGKFFIPITFTFFLYPLTILEEMKLLVFKPGYDSQPPGIQREIEKPDDFKDPSYDDKYFLGRHIHCTNYKECSVSLYKARSLLERRDACSAVRNNFPFSKFRDKKMRNIFNNTYREGDHVGKLLFQSGHDISEEIRTKNELIRKFGLKEKYEQKKK